MSPPRGPGAALGVQGSDDSVSLSLGKQRKTRLVPGPKFMAPCPPPDTDRAGCSQQLGLPYRGASSLPVHAPSCCTRVSIASNLRPREAGVTFASPHRTLSVP